MRRTYGTRILRQQNALKFINSHYQLTKTLESSHINVETKQQLLKQQKVINDLNDKRLELNLVQQREHELD
jgi:hypothetical protein